MSPHPFDIHVGHRIKLARIETNMRQAELANALNISFQQIQKYERGENRTSCSRLYEISQFLNRPLDFFFGGYHKADEATTDSRPCISERLIDSSEALALLKAYKKINSNQVQKSLISIANSLATKDELMVAD